MRRHLGILALAGVVALHASTALAQTTTTSTQTTPSAFDKLSPGGQKIALSLCGAQAGGCPTGQSVTQTSASTQTTTSSGPLTLDQIAQLKQHRGWGEIFKDMQRSGQIQPDVKNLGQLVSGRYQAQSSGGTTITTASGKTQVVGGSGSPGNSGSHSGGQLGKGHSAADGGSSHGGGSSAASHSNAGGRGGGHGK
ncbi:MAG TPA: hypothetical protein VFO18_05310 [Methylomirabilota bacterium]|nr:hypothetical protein [Methylomirabilota bacterium]